MWLSASRAYTPNQASANPIAGNIWAGGAAEFSFESFPIFKNRVREGRGFTVVGNNSASVSLSAAGWPTTDWSCLLWEGQIVPSWLTSGTFKCGFTLVNASDTPTVAADGSAVISNVVQAGAVVTFDMMMTNTGGFQVTGTTAGATNVFAYLPAYPGSSIDDPTSASAFTNEMIAHLKQFRLLRIMPAQAIIGNTRVQSSATRNTPSNVQTRNGITPGWGQTITLAVEPGSGATSTSITSNWLGPTGQYGLGMVSAGNTCGRIVTLTNGSTGISWSVGQPLTEAVTATFTDSVGYDGYPIEWFIALCKAAGIGIWICLPLFEDGTNYSAGSYATAVMNALVSMGFTGEVIFETANEIWNYHSHTLAGIVPFLGFTGSQAVQQYMGYRAHALATLGRSIFGSKWGRSVRQALAWQSGGNGLAFFSQTLAYMQATYGNVSADLSHLAIAPYVTPTIGNTDTVAQIVGYITNGQGTTASDGPRQALRNLSENIATVAMAYGLTLIAYELGGQWNAVNQSAVNAGAAIMDPTMTGAFQAYYAGVLNSPYQFVCHFCIAGVTAVSGNVSPVDDLSNNYANFIASGSPTLSALQTFTNGNFVPTRNVLDAVGDSIDCINYCDNDAVISAAYPYLGQLSGFSVGPHYGTGGYISRTFYSPGGGQIRLSLTVNSTAAGATDVEVNGTVYSSNVAIPNFGGSGTVDLGQVTTKPGWNYLCLGRAGTTQSGVTPMRIARSG